MVFSLQTFINHLFMLLSLHIEYDTIWKFNDHWKVDWWLVSKYEEDTKAKIKTQKQ